MISSKKVWLFYFRREKKMSRTSALKVLDHGMIGAEGADNCHKFVDILGLRTIFPLFMKTPKKMQKTGASEKEHEGQSLISTKHEQTRLPLIKAVCCKPGTMLRPQIDG